MERERVVNKICAKSSRNGAKSSIQLFFFFIGVLFCSCEQKNSGDLAGNGHTDNLNLSKKKNAKKPFNSKSKTDQRILAQKRDSEKSLLQKNGIRQRIIEIRRFDAFVKKPIEDSQLENDSYPILEREKSYFDKFGNVSVCERVQQDGVVVDVNAYNASGDLVGIVHKKDGVIVWKKKYHYEQGILKKILKHPYRDGNPEDGAAALLISSFFYNNKGLLDREEQLSRVFGYRYNALGLVSIKIVIDKAINATVATEYFTHDALGQKIKRVVATKEGEEQVDTWMYDSSGRVILETQLLEGDKKITTKYRYNQLGLIQNETQKNHHTNRVIQKVYTYSTLIAR